MDISGLFRTVAKSALSGLVDQTLGSNGEDSAFMGSGPIVRDYGPLLSGGGFGGGMPMALPAAFPAFGAALGAAGGLMSRALPAVGGAVRVAGSLIRSAAGRITGIALAGGRILSSRKAVLLARRVGIDAAAAALGIGAVEMAQMVIDDQGKHRRGRGVTAAQLRTTRRTMRTVERMHRQILGYCRGAHVPTARRSIPPHRHFIASRRK